MAPRSLTVRIPIRINLHHPPPSSTNLRRLLFRSPRYKGHPHPLRRRPLAAYIDRKRGARLGRCRREVGHPDGAVRGRRHRSTPHDVHLPVVHVHAVAVPGDDLGLGHLEAHQPALHARELLLLQRREPGEVGPLLELHDPAQSRLVRRHRGVDVAPVQGVARLEPQRIARAEAARLPPPCSDQRVPQGFRVRGAAVQLEPVLSRVSGPGDEALHPGDLPLGEVIVGNHRHADGSERCEQRLGPRTLHGEQRGGLRDVAQPYVGAALLRHDVLPVGGDVGGVHDQHEPVLEAIHQTVVHEGALLRQDAGVLGLSWFQRPNVVTGYPLHERVPVWAADLELAHVRYVEHAHVLAYGAVLGRDPRRIADRHFVAAERHQLGAERNVDLVQRGAFHRAMRVASRAFCTCSRFSASSHTRDCGPSITSAVTSSPRWAGRQCRKMAFASASFITSASTVYPLNALRRASVSASCPIEAHTSVFTTCAPSTASSGTSVTSTHAPDALARSKIARFGSNPSGHARRRSNPSTVAASIQLFAMLLPSPTQAIRFSSHVPRASRTVNRSASTWQGCDRSVRPLITGMVAWCASSTTSWWSNVRIMMPLT